MSRSYPKSLGLDTLGPGLEPHRGLGLTETIADTAMMPERDKHRKGGPPRSSIKRRPTGPAPHIVRDRPTLDETLYEETPETKLETMLIMEEEQQQEEAGLRSYEPSRTAPNTGAVLLLWGADGMMATGNLLSGNVSDKKPVVVVTKTGAPPRKGQTVVVITDGHPEYYMEGKVEDVKRTTGMQTVDVELAISKTTRGTSTPVELTVVAAEEGSNKVKLSAIPAQLIPATIHEKTLYLTMPTGISLVHGAKTSILDGSTITEATVHEQKQAKLKSVVAVNVVKTETKPAEAQNPVPVGQTLQNLLYQLARNIEKGDPETKSKVTAPTAAALKGLAEELCGLLKEDEDLEAATLELDRRIRDLQQEIVHLNGKLDELKDMMDPDLLPELEEPTE